MTRLLSIFITAFAICHLCLAQVGGGSVYGQRQSGSDGAQANERAKRTITKDEMPPTSTSMFVEASILMNVKADEYVAIFAVSREGATLEEARQKMDATLAKFSNDLRTLGVRPNDMFVDFVAQNRIYGFDIAGDVAKEKVVGFEVKKNVSVHYRDKAILDRFIAAASTAEVYDLIKVDYIVMNIAAVHQKLMEEAAAVIGRKTASRERLLGVKLRQPAQIYAEKYASYVPTDMYNSYVAQEAEDVSGAYNRQRLNVIGARKARTFYFDALDATTFDHVINPVVTEPVVQFSLYLKVKYDTGPVPAKTVKKAPKRTRK